MRYKHIVNTMLQLQIVGRSMCTRVLFRYMHKLPASDSEMTLLWQRLVNLCEQHSVCFV
jgi:hypothetical protein